MMIVTDAGGRYRHEYPLVGGSEMTSFVETINMMESIFSPGLNYKRHKHAPVPPPSLSIHRKQKPVLRMKMRNPYTASSTHQNHKRIGSHSVESTSPRPPSFILPRPINHPPHLQTQDIMPTKPKKSIINNQKYLHESNTASPTTLCL